MKTCVYFLLAALLLSSCVLATGKANIATTPSAYDLAAFQKSFMSSYYAERGGSPAGTAVAARALTPFNGQHYASGSKATVLATNTSWTSMVGKTTTISGDYPEPGQTTSFTVAQYTTASYVTWTNGNSPSSGSFAVYDIKVTTVFPSTDARKSYFEEYYVADCGPGTGDPGVWTSNDPVVQWVSGTQWIQNQAARVQMLLTFQNGSTRNETIVGSSTTGSSPSCPIFDPAAFDINGSLDLSQAFVPATSTSPYSTSTVSGVVFSSVAMYYVTPTTNYNYWFWAGNNQQTILGIRYYTEVVSGGTYTEYTVSFEKTIGTLTTTGGSFANTLTTITAGSAYPTLAESVLRQQVVYSLNPGTGTSVGNPPTPNLSTGQTTTKMQSRVVNIAGLKDFYLSQLNSDDVALSSWSTSTLYTPTGDATEILAENSSAFLYARSQQLSPATGTLPIAVISVGTGDLATVYSSIMNGTATAAVTGAPSGNLMSSSAEYSFNGQQAVGNSTQSSTSLAQAGTVEAWLYINQMTDTAGIVHKGVAVDFSDECYSLQGWNANGQIGIILDQSGGGNNYDSVLSTINLNLKKWYYVVATWDTSTKKICLYINGSLNASGTMSVTSSGVRDNGSNIIIGSQLPSSYSAQYGYFGLNGEIVGAAVSTSAKTAAQVLATYNSYKGSTASW